RPAALWRRRREDFPAAPGAVRAAVACALRPGDVRFGGERGPVRALRRRHRDGAQDGFRSDRSREQPGGDLRRRGARARSAPRSRPALHARGGAGVPGGAASRSRRASGWLDRGRVSGSEPAARRAYDEIDFAAPATGAVEATASLSQWLWTKSGRTAGRIFGFDLLQDALLWAGGAKARLSEGSAVASVRFGAGSLDGSIRY